ncbi:hybrid sensor histidine kinase/response regulator [Candidatus Marithrix sp. Canyon 246]|uniref:hybrid sensor histidine kinase/response regulator n=1 Tax=Candidatus Marithrix sp. Canyon 246 TaxID=1827136 RepID=UPI0009F722C0|nr:hybrid sensor histidine kinase/response regulator [Candidatus Marithrix sp. Canyon 246]
MEKDILEIVCQQIIESSEGLTVALEKCLSMANDSPEFLEAIEEYTNKVQEIWDVAELAGLNGLLDVCTFINDNLMAFLIADDTTKALHYFEQWPLKVLEYLQSSNASELIAFMQETAWPMPLESEAASYLLKLLVSEEKTHNDLQPLKIPEEIKDISLGSTEVIEALSQEIESIQSDLQQALDSIDEYTELMQRIYIAAEMLEMKGLQSICLFIISNVSFLQDATVAETKQVTSLLEKWPKFVLDYFTAPTDNIIELVNYLRDATWIHPLTDDDAYTLLNQLTKSLVIQELEEQTIVKRQTKAVPDDVSLTIPSDINQELLEAYLEETPQLTVDFSESIQFIIDNYNLDEIRRAQRLAHTLKGSSNIIGIKGIANIAHNLEDILVYFTEHNTKPPKNLTDTLVEAGDCLALMVETLLGQNQEQPQLALNVLQTLLDWANNIDKGNIEAPSVSSTPTPVATVSSTPVTEEAQPVLRVRTKTIDELMRLVGELSISTKQIQERLKHVLLNTHRLTEQNSQIQKKSFELEHLVDVRCITNVFHNINKIENIEGFDPLEFEAYNELHSITHGFIESIADNRELTQTIYEELDDLESIVIEQERLNKDFQTNLMTTRMVPVKNLITKLKRNIRQTSRTTGKEVELEVIGTEILIDSDILNNLADPLQHILRNAIDHGIEIPEQRHKSGKSATGLIKLSFYHEGNNIVVKCQDDGQGLNYPKIHATALERGLITQHQELTEQELARLILMSGFSTKSDVTQMSGRGIGMDVVHTNIREMKGTLDLSSETGKGTTISMKLPMTLVTVHVLLVRVANQHFAIPSNFLELAIAPNVGTFQHIGEQIHFRLEKEIYALRDLANLLNISRDKAVLEQAEKYPIILVREETGITAVLVDEVLDTQDLVMKRMGKYVNNIHGVTGAAILGNGSIVPLLDLPELLRSSLSASYTTDHKNQTMTQSSTIITPRVMIVDDSLSVRKSLSLTMEKAGFDTVLAKDGIEAIEIIKNTMPTIMLVDMEMPRMNGLELSKYIRAHKETKNIPIFMITSRTTEKHREQAKLVGIDHYFTKPYNDKDLLDMIENAIE